MDLHNVSTIKPREWFSTAEIARMVGRAEYTVREWARQGRMKARKRAAGRGRYLAWEIHADALWSYLEHGLEGALPPPARGRSC